MAVNLDRLPADEEALRQAANDGRLVKCEAIQNVLDALNWFRCKAKFAEQELAKAKVDLDDARTAAEHLRRLL